MTRSIDEALLARFTTVYENRLWGDQGSVSGPGSRKDNPMVASAIAALTDVIERFHITSIADIPCGDFHFLEETITRACVHYVGFDIVSQLIDENRRKWPDLDFEQIDIASDVPPPFDLIFSKELLIHLDNRCVVETLSNMKRSGSKYLLASNSFGVENVELDHNYLGYARPIDLLATPFSFPMPLWNNNFYALWDFAQLPLPDGI